VSVDGEGVSFRLRKGDRVKVVGYFQKRSYEKDGETKIVRQFVVVSIEPVKLKVREESSSAGFRYESVKQADGTLTLVYLPPVFSMQPGTSEEVSISFVSMPLTAWVDEQAAAIGDSLGSDAREAALAAYFVAYLAGASVEPVQGPVAGLQRAGASVSRSAAPFSTASRLNSIGRY
jgi:hypothetical protein